MTCICFDSFGVQLQRRGGGEDKHGLPSGSCPVQPQCCTEQLHWCCSGVVHVLKQCLFTTPPPSNPDLPCWSEAAALRSGFCSYQLNLEGTYFVIFVLLMCDIKMLLLNRKECSKWAGTQRYAVPTLFHFTPWRTVTFFLPFPSALYISGSLGDFEWRIITAQRQHICAAPHNTSS